MFSYVGKSSLPHAEPIMSNRETEASSLRPEQLHSVLGPDQSTKVAGRLPDEHRPAEKLLRCSHERSAHLELPFTDYKPELYLNNSVH